MPVPGCLQYLHERNTDAGAESLRAVRHHGQRPGEDALARDGSQRPRQVRPDFFFKKAKEIRPVDAAEPPLSWHTSSTLNCLFIRE